MILLTSTSDLLRVTTSTTANIDVHASYVDLSGTTVTPSRTNTTISTATTTTVVSSPASSTQRTVKTLFIRNRHATTTNDITILHTDGTTSVEFIKVSLNAGYTLRYDEGNGFEVLDSFGRSLLNNSDNGSNAAVNALNLVVLGSDVTNNNATANTMADVTGLSFSVTAGEKYWFYANIQYTSAATGTGSRWSMNGPSGTWRFSSQYSLTATSFTLNTGLSAVDTPAASNATSATTGSNNAWIEGFFECTVTGTVVVRFASEVSSSAIVAKAGSVLQWVRVL
jgi:hypothetical protein